jgi:hypothetical protein
MANKQIHGKQCTIIRHVVDLKMSHVEKKVVEDIIHRLSERFGKESPLTTSRGKLLEYLGLTLDYSVRGREKDSRRGTRRHGRCHQDASRKPLIHDQPRLQQITRENSTGFPPYC